MMANTELTAFECIPMHLSHTPVIKLENHQAIDGAFACATDAQGLSVGLAQWNGVGKTDFSAKIWRYDESNPRGGRWSRQSEEISLHRTLDLASLVCASIYYAKHGSFPSGCDYRLGTSADSYHEELLRRFIEKDDQYLQASLQRLASLVNQLI